MLAAAIRGEIGLHVTPGKSCFSTGQSLGASQRVQGTVRPHARLKADALKISTSIYPPRRLLAAMSM
jgi:hypothetical protein